MIQPSRKLVAFGVTWLGVALGHSADAPHCAGQTSSLFQQAAGSAAMNASTGDGVPAYDSLQRGSWTYLNVPPPKQIRVNDFISIRVEELSRVQSEGQMERRKTNQYDAILLDWIRLVGLKAIKPSPQSDGDQRVRGQTLQTYRAEGELETRESLVFNITAKIVDIRPNGNLVLEAHRQLKVNNEAWDYSLSGECRREDVLPDNTVLSRHIADLRIEKRDRGHVRDSYRRGWFQRWFDQLQPF